MTGRAVTVRPPRRYARPTAEPAVPVACAVVPVNVIVATQVLPFANVMSRFDDAVLVLPPDVSVAFALTVWFVLKYFATPEVVLNSAVFTLNRICETASAMSG
jgi:hypothetical protein